MVIAAGGTGGHMFPAQALAGALAGRGRDIVLVTDRRGAEYGGAIAGTVLTVSAGTVSGRGLPGRLMGLGQIAFGAIQAHGILRRLAPAGVVGFGGYASVPTMLAATRIGLPTVIHEQNAVLGRANRLMAPRVRAIAAAFAETAQLCPADRAKAEHTGNPVRAAIAALAERPYPAPERGGPLSLLVIGGSQGAVVMSEVVPAALAALPEELRARLEVVQQCRADDLDETRETYRAAGIAAELADFFDDLPARLAQAHLVIARAGASTVAELANAGRPAILVPYPSATDDHQTRNAEALCEVGGGWLMPQQSLTVESLCERLRSLLATPALLTRAAQSALSGAHRDAAEKLADVVFAHHRSNGKTKAVEQAA
ncbi:MAG: undecaprenyldiphospho-muramoylpentapeptide beta-N-acetylglucosaminyltransferase [Alphaproteobacteria bacterium]|nr:undecaprenyldiphospho-muramoylpentapeptide beta-N-acetylglucosaminyltransferase [Alphaproteobacteria bacterium]